MQPKPNQILKIVHNHLHYGHFSPFADVFKGFIEVEELQQRPPALQKKDFLKSVFSFQWLCICIHIYILYLFLNLYLYLYLHMTSLYLSHKFNLSLAHDLQLGALRLQTVPGGDC